MIQRFKKIIQQVKKLKRGRLLSKHSHFNSLFTPNTTIKRVATGFRFTEGPVWFPKEQYLLFSDIPSNKIYKLDVNENLTIFRQPSGHANGLTRDNQGRLITCEHGNRSVTRTEKNGEITILASSYQGKRLNSPNDIVVKRDGSIYFTDPPYGINPSLQELPFQAVFRISSDGHHLDIVSEDFARPNGLAFSLDETKLYIDDSSNKRHIRVFDVNSDGSLSSGAIFLDMNIEKRGAPDGMKVNQKGQIFCTGPAGVWVISPQGEHLGTIATSEKPSNCAWGGIDYKTLYITAQTSVYKVSLTVPGIKT